MTNAQTVAAGQPVARRFTRISSPVTAQASSPEGCFGMIVGKPGCGKTHLFLTNPEAFVINADRSQIPLVPNAEALNVWPVKDAQGQLVDHTGQPFHMRWENIQSTLDILVDMAAQNEPRPKVVALDTIAGLVSLCMEWIVRTAGRDHWNDLDGRWAWNKLYETVIDTALRLRAAGYSPWFICHLVDKVLDLPGSEGKQKIVSLTITDNFWSRLFWQLDFVGVVVQESVTKTVMVEQTGGGRTRRIPKSETVVARTLTATRPEYTGIAKTRVPLPDTTLSPESAWADFAAAYTAASTPNVA